MKITWARRRPIPDSVFIFTCSSCGLRFLSGLPRDLWILGRLFAVSRAWPLFSPLVKAPAPLPGALCDRCKERDETHGLIVGDTPYTGPRSCLCYGLGR
jgi:hypothetical protein